MSGWAEKYLLVKYYLVGCLQILICLGLSDYYSKIGKKILNLVETQRILARFVGWLTIFVD